MKVLVDRLTETPVSMPFEGEGKWLESVREIIPELAGELARPFRFESKIHKIGADIYLEGKMAGAFELGCARCLARYCHPVQDSFRLVLEPASAKAPQEGEEAISLEQDGVCLGDELEAGWFQGSEIDLGTYFRELIALSVPVQPLCSEQCRGLCSQCGIDRNRESCHCDENNPASPFAALAALRGKLSEGEKENGGS